MRAAVCNAYGPPTSLQICDVPDPVAGPGEVVVDIASGAVNFPDVLLIANRYQVSAPLPFIPGSEFAGSVSAVGPKVDHLAVGDRVFGAVMVGAFAERIAVPAAAVRPIPDEVAMDVAAAFWVAHTTAYHSLRSVAAVEPGEVVVVLGAGGGVGLAAVELAAGRGATVIAAASTDDKLALCRARGAAHVVNYGRDDLRQAIRAAAPNGVDVVIDPVGGPSAEAALRCLRWRGRFVTVGYASGEIPRIPLNLVLLKGCVIKGFEMRSFTESEPELTRRDLGELVELLSAGRVTPHISAVHELTDVAAALTSVAERRSAGKVLVRCSPGHQGRGADDHATGAGG